MASQVNLDAQQKKLPGKAKELRAEEEEKKQKTQKIAESAKPILEEQALLREKLKSAPAWKKESTAKKKLQPVVVRPPSPNLTSAASINAGLKQLAGYTAPSQQNLRPSSPPYRRRTPSSSPSSSPGPSTPRSASPTLLLDVEMAGENQQKVEKAMKIRLYLLQQTGPNSFLIGGDSPSHKFRVMIGPQTCSCSKGPFCVHLLFVMLRVFKVKDNDPMLWEKQLKNYEVEMLFHKFHASVSSRIGSKTKVVSKGKSTHRRGSGSPVSSSTSLSGPTLLTGSSLRNDEEVQCPICLLEMVDGESLTICDGCTNSLHQHCMAIWAAECKRQKEPLVCPLCRKVWANKTKTAENGEKRLSGVQPSPPSPTVQVDAIPLDQDLILPHADPIPAEQVEVSKPWVEIFGEELVSCLFSREWNCREKALLHLCRDVKYMLTNENSSTFPENLVCICSRIVAMLCADPVYPVYVQAVRAFRVLLAYLAYKSTAESLFLQKEFSPILEAIFTKCADSNRRVSALSVKTLLELCKDECGDMALGSALPVRDETSQSLGGLNYVLSRTLVRSPENVTWSWWLGRLNLLGKLLEDSPDHFSIDTETVDYKKVASGITLPAAPNKLPEDINRWQNNFSRLMFIVHFAIKAVSCPHSTGNKLALRILTRCLRLASKVKSAYVQVKTCLCELKKSDRNALQRQLKHRCAPQRGLSVDSAHSTSSGENSQNYSKTSSSPVSDGGTLDGIPNLCGDVDVQMSELENFQAVVESIADDDYSFPLTPPVSPSQDVNKRECTLSPSLPPIDVPLTTTNCQKKIEDEEAEALAIAIEASSLQPLVPPAIEKLVADDNEEIIVRIQPEVDEKDGAEDKHVYLEGVHWTKTDLIGTGAFSSCYAARDKGSGTLMAVKQVSFCRNSSDEQQKVIDTIQKEISILSKVQHPNLTRCLGVTRHAGHFNIFLEWMAGGSLANLLFTHGPLEEKVAINYTQQIIRGVAYLHEHKVIHRDVKGANILLDSTGHVVKVADFGAVARLKTQKTFSGEFQGQLLGTIAFMAPEVLRGESYGRKCDVWSIGCVVVEMMTGKPPWNAHQHSNHLALIFKIACSISPPEVPEGLNPAFRDLILRCLHTNPQERSPALELLKHPVFTRVCC